MVEGALRAIINGSMSVEHAIDFLLDCFFIGFWFWYVRRYWGSPQFTGSLRSSSLIHFMRRAVIPQFERYFSFRVIAHQTNDRVKVDQSAQNKYIFSFHPHGVFPATALIAPHTKSWMRATGDRETKISLHAASVIFNVPLLRDFTMGLGGRIVTRSSIENSLRDGNSVMIVTGGQSEMLLTRASDLEMHLVTHHLGFVRIAVRQQVPLVPVLCFAENNVMDNVHVPWLQKRMLRLIGFPFPTLPHGRWYMPVPNKTPLTVVVGAPLAPPPGLVAADEAGIRALGALYFKQLEELFYRYRAEAGYPHMKLILH
jgi:hypothetical protein